MSEKRPDAATQLYDYLRLLLKHRWLIIAVMLVTVSSAAAFTFTQTPIYQASATVLIEPEAPQVLNIQEVQPMAGSMSQEYYGTQYRLIQSQPVIMGVIRRLKLEERIEGFAGNPYGKLLSRLKVDPVKNTRLVLIKYEDTDPAMAAEVANAVAEEYVRHNLEIKRNAARDAVAWLSDQMKELRAKGQQSSALVQSYRAKANLLGLQEQRQVTTQKIIDSNRAYLEAQNQRLSVEAKLRELSRIMKDKAGGETIFTVVDDPLIRKLKAEASDLQVTRAKLLQMYRPNHPDVRQVDAQLEQVNTRIEAELQKLLKAIQTEHQVAKAREETLLGNVNELKREANVLAEREREALALIREDESNEHMQEAVLKRIKEAGIATAIEANNVRLVERAHPPGRPARPRTNLILALSLVLGTGLGVGAAFVVESLDRSLRSAEDVEQVLKLPLLAIVPRYESHR